LYRKLSTLVSPIVDFGFSPESTICCQGRSLVQPAAAAAPYTTGNFFGLSDGFGRSLSEEK